MADQNVEPFADDQLSVPGHTALVAYNHSTKAQSLSCDVHQAVTALNPFPTVDYPPHELAEDLGVIDRANARAREAEEGRTDSAPSPAVGEFGSGYFEITDVAPNSGDPS